MPELRRARSLVNYKETSFTEENDGHKTNGKDEILDLMVKLRGKLNLVTPRRQYKRRSRIDGELKGRLAPSSTEPIILLERCNSKPGSACSTPRRGRGRPRKAKEPLGEVQNLPKTPSQSKHELDDDSMDVAVDKPTALFTDDDVEGKKLYSFKMMHRKNDLLRKALESPKTPKKPHKSISTSNTPKSSRKSLLTTPTKKTHSQNCTPTKGVALNRVSTPYSLRVNLKKKIQAMIDSDEDFSEDSSDFSPSDKSESESDDDESQSDNDSSEDEVLSVVAQKKNLVKSTAKSYSTRNRRNRDSNYVVKSDNYFSLQGNKKIVTSNRTLERLKNPRLSEDRLQNILSKEVTISKEHVAAIKNLNKEHESMFDKWLFVLSEGFSIVLHGLGSKERLMRKFQDNRLSTYPCIVINGFFPSLMLKDILDSFITEMLELSNTPSNMYEAVELIEQEMASIDEHVFLLVHNIDGIMLRNNKSQYVLSKLSKIKNIHLIASIDHINAPLSWDHKILSDYNFSWWDATTFSPYTHETSYENSLLVNKSGALALSSLRNVFNSLTSNAKNIFKIIVDNQLLNKKTPHYQGMSFKELYTACRENFYVSSDLALRAQLTEFLDHKLVKTKRSIDGSENLVIPIESVLLEKFYEDNDD